MSTKMVKTARKVAVALGCVGLIGVFAATAEAQPPEQGQGWRQGPPALRGGPRNHGRERGPWGPPRLPRFEDLDTDGDGVLSHEEYSAIRRTDGAAKPGTPGDGSPSKDVMPGRPKPAELDVNGDGALSFEEVSVLPHMTEEHFGRLDSNTDGVLGQDEFPPRGRRARGGQGFRGPQGSGEGHGKGLGQHPPLFERLDADGDGTLSYEEASVIPRINEERFAELDKNGDGVLAQEELPRPPRRGHGPHSGEGRGVRSGPRGGQQ